MHQITGAFFYQRFQLDTVDQVDGVEHIALGLGHFVAVCVAHQAVNVNLFERHIVHELQAHHDHARDPEENNVKAGDQHAGGVEGLQSIGLLWPAQGGEGPQGRAEPGVEHVLILVQFKIRAQAVLFAHFAFGTPDIHIALCVIPGGDTVSPPDLS